MALDQSFFPSLLAPRRRVDVGVARGDHAGLDRGRVDSQGRRPRRRTGVESGISKSEVSRICGELDTDVAAEVDDPPMLVDRPVEEGPAAGDLGGGLINDHPR
jgi:hypothetical protein